MIGKNGSTILLSHIPSIPRMIIVFTLSRSGSSLMMQTLKILGIEVMGSQFAPGASAEHNAFNPKGFYETKNVYRNGLKSQIFAEEKSFVNHALKLDFKNIVSQDNLDDWLEWDKKVKAIYVTTREPLEQANSTYLLFNHPRIKQVGSSSDHFIFVVRFLKSYVESFLDFAELMENQLSVYKSRVHIVDYQEAITNPACYVEKIIETLFLNPVAEQINSAIENIEADLYRFRKENLPDRQQVWLEKTHAKQVYEVLSTSPVNEVWANLLSLKADLETIVC